MQVNFCVWMYLLVSLLSYDRAMSRTRLLLCYCEHFCIVTRFFFLPCRSNEGYQKFLDYMMVLVCLVFYLLKCEQPQNLKNYFCKRSLKKLFYVLTMVKLQVDTDLVVTFLNFVIVPSLVHGCVVYYGFLVNTRSKKQT